VNIQQRFTTEFFIILLGPFLLDEYLQNPEEQEQEIKEYDPLRAQEEWNSVRNGTQTTKMERDAWMVEIPTSRGHSLDFGLMQRNVTHFSRRGVIDRGDSSSWTDDPTERQRRQAGLTPKTTLQMAKQMAMHRVMLENAENTAKVVKQYNEKFRSESLLDIHLEQKYKEHDKKKIDKSENSEKEEESGESKNKKRKKKKKDSGTKKTKKSKSKDNNKKTKKRKRGHNNESQKEKKVEKKKNGAT